MEVFLLSISLGYVAVTVIFYITMLILAVNLYFYIRKRLAKHDKVDLSEEVTPDE